MMVRHLDGCRLNNRRLNLRYGTAAENAADSIRHGTLSQGEAHYAAKVTASDISTILARCAAGERQADVGADYAIGQAAVSAIVCGKNWKSIARVLA